MANRFSLLPSGSFLGTRQSLVDSIAADDRSAELARRDNNAGLVEHYTRGSAMGRKALARHDAMAARAAAPSSEPASGMRLNPTLVGVAPAPATQRQVSSSTKYSFVNAERKRSAS